MLTFNVDLHLIFGIPDRAINAEVNVEDFLEASKHYADSKNQKLRK